jgi:hypothetical protein
VRESSPVRVLRVLAEHPEGLRLAQVAALAGEDTAGYASTLRRLEECGSARREGPRRKTLWFITPHGAERLASGKFRAARGSFTHGTQYGYRARCRCDACRAWQHAEFQKRYPGSAMQKHSSEHSRQWRAANPEKREAEVASKQEANRKSREAAARHYWPWTGTELEIASREDLTEAQVASMLGRTLGSVNTMRGKLRDDPRLQMLRDGAPLPTGTAAPRRVRVPFSAPSA